MNNQNNQQSKVCMACQCSCEMHKEHTHPVEEMTESQKQKEIKSCAACGTPHKQDNVPACGCH